MDAAELLLITAGTEGVVEVMVEGATGAMEGAAGMMMEEEEMEEDPDPAPEEGARREGSTTTMLRKRKEKSKGVESVSFGSSCEKERDKKNSLSPNPIPEAISLVVPQSEERDVSSTRLWSLTLDLYFKFLSRLDRSNLDRVALSVKFLAGGESEDGGRVEGDSSVAEKRRKNEQSQQIESARD